VTFAIGYRQVAVNATVKSISNEGLWFKLGKLMSEYYISLLAQPEKAENQKRTF
jgi:hypothetical protein